MKNLKIFKLLFIFITIFNLFFLTGCWNYTEMDQQLNVAGIAIDKGHNGKKFHISVEVITTGKNKNMQNSAEIIEADEDTIFSAVRSVITTTSKRLYFGHCKTLVIGEEIAKDGISDVIDFLYRDAELRISMNVILTKGCSGKDILNSKGVDNDIIAYEIDDLIKASEKSGSKSFKIQIYNIINLLQTQGKDLIIPAFEMTKVEDYETFKSLNAGVFKKDKLVGYINTEERKLYTIVNNQLKSGIINLKLPEQENQYLAFEVYKSKTKIKSREVNGKLTVDLFVKTDVFIGEMDTQNDYSNKSERNTITLLLEKQMKNNIEKLFDKCKNELDCDIFGFGKQIHNSNPKLWLKYKDNWDEEFKKLDINVNYKIKIRGTGVGSSTIRTL